MCVAIPAKLIEIKENNIGLVDIMGARQNVALDLLADSVKLGDYLLIHVGYAINILDEEEALKTLEIFKEIAELQDTV